MRLGALTIQGFRSFTGQQEFDFSKLKPGLYHLGGRNDVEPAISPNGAGKSSLLEAPCWIAYGTTSRKLKAGAVRNWDGKEQCGGILEVKTAQHDLGIFRVSNSKGNTLEVSIDGAPPRPIDQRELDELLGLNFDSYLFSMYFAQFAPAFIDLQPAQQMAAFSAALGLDLWAQAAEAAGKRASVLEATIRTHREALARLEGRLEAEEAALHGLDASEQEWLEGMVKKEEELETAAEGAKKSVKAARAERDEHAEGSKKFREWREKVQKAASDLTVNEHEVRRLEKEVSALSGKEKVTKCPACDGPITVEHLKAEKKKQQAALDTAKEKSADLLAVHDAHMREMVKFRSAEGKLLDAEKKLSTAEAQQRSVELMLKNLREEENPFDKKRANMTRTVKELREDRERAASGLQVTEQEQGAAQFWSKSFKELRLSLIEESLVQLSIEANSALVELGLRDWSLEFDVERETKKGTVSKGFTILVHAPHVKEPVPWECWSGGESQRLRVAASLGFAELICSRMGVQPNVELWDEPSQWLSEGGIYDLLTSLAERAERKKKVILLADHRALDFGGFAGSIMVAKTARGSEVS